MGSDGYRTIESSVPVHWQRKKTFFAKFVFDERNTKVSFFTKKVSYKRFIIGDVVRT